MKGKSRKSARPAKAGLRSQKSSVRRGAPRLPPGEARHDAAPPLAIATSATTPFARIEDAIEAIRHGRMVIVVDDADRENEGDLTIAAENVTPEAINFMARYGRGSSASR